MSGARFLAPREYARQAAVRYVPAATTSAHKYAPVSTAPARRSRPHLTIANAFGVGRLAGARYGGDPFRCARAWHLAIEYLSDLPVMGRLLTYADGTASIQLSTSRLAAEGRRSVAHECGHHYDLAASDELARLFAAGFLSAA